MARVVVIGGGLGGTASAARLAKLGHEVVLLERTDRLGGAIGFVELDGYRWDSGPTTTALPAVLRDLFRKSGRPLERELELVRVEPMREHRFEDGTSLRLPSGSRAAQQDAIDGALGAPRGRQWLAYTASYADTWNLVRRNYLERGYSPGHLDRQTRAVLETRQSLYRAAHKALPDPRLRAVALGQVVLDGQDPRRVPAWLGMMAYVEQNFGVWTIRGGMGQLAQALTRRLVERKVEVRLGTTARDLLLRNGRVAGVSTDAGQADAEVVVVAVDPRSLPALAGAVRGTRPASPPDVCHLGLRGDLPDLAPEVMLHGDPPVVVRTGGGAPAGGQSWTLLRHGQASEDILLTLARRGVDVRGSVDVRLDRPASELVTRHGGSPYGVLWQGRATMRRRIGTCAPVAGVFCAGASASPGSGVPFVGLGAALVAQAVGKA